MLTSIKLGERIRSFFFNRIALLFFILFLFLVVAAMISYKNLMTVVMREQRVEYSLQVIRTLKNIVIDSIGAETGERGYVITGNESYLAPYTAALGRIDQDLKALENLSQNHPILTSQIPVLRQDVNSELQVLKKTVNLRQSSGFDAAQAELQSGEEKHTMDLLRAQLEKMENQRESSLGSDIQSLKDGITTAVFAFTISTLVNVLLLILVFKFISNEFSRRKEFEQRKDEFISIASHELKTPLTTLKVVTQVLKLKLAKFRNRELSKYVVQLNTQVDHLTELINDLLDLSKIQSGKVQYKMEVFNLDELIKETVDSIQSTTTKQSIVVKGRVAHTVIGDRNRIAQVMINLLTNAVKYSSDANKIIVHAGKNNKFSAKISVQDFGIGIDQSQINKIFERFYRVSDPVSSTIPGLGIGLYISSDIIKRHGGRLWVKSEKGKGSTFSFVLPFKPPKTPKNQSV